MNLYQRRREPEEKGTKRSPSSVTYLFYLFYSFILFSFSFVSFTQINKKKISYRKLCFGIRSLLYVFTIRLYRTTIAIFASLFQSPNEVFEVYRAICCVLVVAIVVDSC